MGEGGLNFATAPESQTGERGRRPQGKTCDGQLASEDSLGNVHVVAADCTASEPLRGGAQLRAVQVRKLIRQ